MKIGLKFALKNQLNYLGNGNALMRVAKLALIAVAIDVFVFLVDKIRDHFQVLIFTRHVNNLPANCLSTRDRRHPVHAKIPNAKGPKQ